MAIPLGTAAPLLIGVPPRVGVPPLVGITPLARPRLAAVIPPRIPTGDIPRPLAVGDIDAAPLTIPRILGEEASPSEAAPRPRAPILAALPLAPLIGEPPLMGEPRGDPRKAKEAGFLVGVTAGDLFMTAGPACDDGILGAAAAGLFVF